MYIFSLEFFPSLGRDLNFYPCSEGVSALKHFLKKNFHTTSRRGGENVMIDEQWVPRCRVGRWVLIYLACAVQFSVIHLWSHAHSLAVVDRKLPQ